MPRALSGYSVPSPFPRVLQRPGCRSGHAAAGLPLLGRSGALHGRQEAGDSGGRRRAQIPPAARTGAPFFRSFFFRADEAPLFCST